MEGRIYTVPFGRVAGTAQQDFFELTPADDKPIEIIGIALSQSSDAGDAQDEMLSFAIIRGNATAGSGGTSVTPQKCGSTANAAAGFTAKVNNTTVAAAGAGTVVTLMEDAFNVRAGHKDWYPDGCGFAASQVDTTIVVRLLTTPADSLTFSGTLWVRELG